MSTKNYFWLYIKIAIQAVLHVIVANIVNDDSHFFSPLTLASLSILELVIMSILYLKEKYLQCIISIVVYSCVLFLLVLYYGIHTLIIMGKNVGEAGFGFIILALLLPIAILDLLIVARYLRKIISEDSSGTWPVVRRSE